MKTDENTDIDRGSLQIFWTTWEISMKVTKDMTYDNIKSHKKTGFHLLFRRLTPQPFSVKWLKPSQSHVISLTP